MWTAYGIILMVVISCTRSEEDLQKSKQRYANLTTIEFIEGEGYPAENHPNVQTSDGYLLDLHRIPHGKNNSDQKNKPVVLLMHGLLCSSIDWVSMGSKKSIAYQLADAGYDVWLGNARGNKWSRKHIKYNPDSDCDFWMFSWHEIGTIDLPAMIDYILKFTKQEKLHYIGHSQGTTSFFVMASEKPEYNKKIRLMVAFAPVAYMSHIKSHIFQLISKHYKSLKWLTMFLGVYEFLPSHGFLAELGQKLCRKNSPFQGICASVLFLIAGWDSEQLDRDKIPVILSNYPAGASTRQFIHYAQEVYTGKFQKYDHGPFYNFMKYKSIDPPNYRTSAITAPVALIYSENDKLAAVEDVERLAKELPNATPYLVQYPKFNHLDYLYAIDCRELVYNHVLELLSKY